MEDNHVSEHPPESTTPASHLFDSIDSEGGAADDPFAQFGSEQDDYAPQRQVQEEEHKPGFQATTEGEAPTPVAQVEGSRTPIPANVLEKQTEEKAAYAPEETEEVQGGGKTQEFIGEQQGSHITSSPVQEPTAGHLFGPVSDGSGEDLFAQLAESEKDEFTQPEQSQDILKSEGIDQSEAQGQTEVSVPHEEKDYSDLLAEFEAENGMLEPPIGGPVKSHSESKGEGIQSLLGQSDTKNDQTPAASSLFIDDPNDSVFDNIIPESDSEPQEAPLSTTAGTLTNPSIQGLFSNDTTDFLNQGQIITEAQEAGGLDQSGVEPLDFDIPQGWYDDDGQWQWYTEEEKEQVKFAMMGPTSWQETEQAPPPLTAGAGASMWFHLP